jgi:hypothetical protein
MFEHVVDEIEMRATVVKTRIDVSKTDIDQRIHLVDMCRGNNRFHGELHGFAQLAMQSILIKRV